METQIPKYSLDFANQGPDHFFMYMKNERDASRPPALEAPKDNYYIMTFLYKGTISHFSDLVKKEIQQPALLLVNSDHIDIHTDTSHCSIISMSFSPQFIEGYSKRMIDCLNTVFSLTYIKFRDKELDELNEFIQILAFEYGKEGKTNWEIIKSLLSIILIRCTEISDLIPKNLSDKNGIFREFTHALKKNYMNSHRVTFYADKLNITAEILNQVVKQASSSTPKQLIDQQLLLEAKKVLYWTDISVKELAWKLGFDTDSYFNRFFKKYTGTTPKQFQKSVQRQ